MEFCLKWVHMARYELILKQVLGGGVRAIWFRIILKHLLTPKTTMEGPNIQKESKIKILPIKETRSHGKLGLF